MTSIQQFRQRSIFVMNLGGVITCVLIGVTRLLAVQHDLFGAIIVAKWFLSCLGFAAGFWYNSRHPDHPSSTLLLLTIAFSAYLSGLLDAPILGLVTSCVGSFVLLVLSQALGRPEHIMLWNIWVPVAFVLTIASRFLYHPAAAMGSTLDLIAALIGGGFAIFFTGLFHVLYSRVFSDALAQSERMRQTLQQNHLALEQAHVRATSANQAKTTFLANMSHELRTPLNAIIGYTEMILEEVEEGGEEEFPYCDDLRKIHASGNLLLSHIREILDLSKIEAGKSTLQLEEVEFLPLFEQVRTALEPLLKAQRNRLSIELDDDFSHTTALWIDKEKLLRIFTNLLHNAAKFMVDGEIRVRIRNFSRGEELGIQCLIIDTGCGIASSQWSQLFDPFSQGEESRVQPHRGIGLGLSIARYFAEQMGGFISFTSELSKGSTFCVWIPLQVRNVAD